jgi:hypothetical protein
MIQGWDRFSRLGCFLALTLAAVCAMSSFGSAQTARDQLDVYMVRQDFSDCSNANVQGDVNADPSPIGAKIHVERGSDGITRVNVSLGGAAQSNTTYHFFLKCVQFLGDIQTYDEKDGNADFQFPTNLVGNVYAFDMYPEGAPSGNKFQSVQVRF